MKTLRYAYPSSDSAELFGHGATGCLVVDVDGEETAFLSGKEALEYFNSIDCEVAVSSYFGLFDQMSDDARTAQLNAFDKKPLSCQCCSTKEGVGKYLYAQDKPPIVACDPCKDKFEAFINR